MTSEEMRRQIIKNIYDAIDRADWETFYSHFDDNAILHEAESLPYGGVYRGISEIKHGLSKMFEAWDDLRFHVEEVTAGGDLVFVYLHGCATGKKTGKTFAFPFAELWRFRGDKIIELRPFYWDTHRARECFGD